MNRTALRLSTIAALLGGGHQPYPTLARGLVRDSMQDPIDDLVQQKRLPVIVVRTDTDARRRAVAATAPTGFGERDIELRIEASVLTAAKDDDGNYVVGWGATDAELEATLDLLEYQIEAALFGSSDWSVWWRKLWSNVLTQDSVPLWTRPEEGKVRLAVRELTLNMRVAFDCLPPPLRMDQITLDGDGNPIVPSSLPARLLAIFDKIDADGGDEIKDDFAAIRAVLEARDLPKSTVYPVLHSVRTIIGTPPTNSEEAYGEGVAAELLADLPEPDGPDWIMEFGAWNDAGLWADGSEWNDGD